MPNFPRQKKQITPKELAKLDELERLKNEAKKQMALEARDELCESRNVCLWCKESGHFNNLCRTAVSRELAEQMYGQYKLCRFCCCKSDSLLHQKSID